LAVINAINFHTISMLEIVFYFALQTNILSIWTPALAAQAALRLFKAVA